MDVTVSLAVHAVPVRAITLFPDLDRTEARVVHHRAG